ncbi:hypothetical protein ADK75_07080, partial [Streptomyces virginiae]
MTQHRRRLTAWLLAGVVLAVVLTLYRADRTAMSEHSAAPGAGTSATPSATAPPAPSDSPATS